MTRPRVAVLGAGIMGSATALFLARGGADVVLYDSEARPFSGASGWNEGKIHLGFLYAADPSMRTAERIIPGGLAFRPLVRDLIGCDLELVTPDDDVALVHRDSVVSPDHAAAYFGLLGERLRDDPAATDYLTDVSDARIRRLSPGQIAEIADPELIVAGFSIPERSVSTRWVADRFADALAASATVELRMSTTVRGVRRRDHGPTDPMCVVTSAGVEGPYDFTVNALWAGRPRIDSDLGVLEETVWSYRYRLAAFITTTERVAAPSAVVITGPFGDIKNYNGRQFYLSWYPAGLVAVGEDIDPPRLPELDADIRRQAADESFERLARLIPAAATVRDRAAEVRVEGGWVYAVGRGELDDPTSALHRRDRIGVSRYGSYFSVDTGKYSTAPWLALQVASAILGD